jgi:tetratricopeptide (TPR) repeat protein
LAESARAGAPHVALSLNNLAALHEAMAHHAEAEPLFAQSLEILQRRLSPSHPQVVKSLNNLAELYRKSGREIEAAEMEKRAPVK